MKSAVAIFLAAFAGYSNAAPFLDCDPYPSTLLPKPTMVQVFIDAATVGIDSPVLVDSTGVHCHYDLAGTSVGAHTIRAKFIYIDPAWGRVESVQFGTLNFTRPGPPQVPSGLILAPQ